MERRSFMAGIGAFSGLTLAGCGEGDQAAEPSVFLPFSSAPVANSNKRLLQVQEDDSYIEQLGRSGDSVTGELWGALVTGERVRTRVSPTAEYSYASLNHEVVETQSHYRARIRSSAKAKARYQIFSGSGSISQDREDSKDSYSLRVMALAKRFDHAVVFRDGTARIVNDAEANIRRRRRNPNLLLAQYGNGYVASARPSNELLIDIVFGTSSESKRVDLRGQLSAGISGLGSARGSYSQFLSSATSAKSVSIFIAGLDRTFDWRRLSEGETEDALARFYSDETRPAFANLELRSLRNISFDRQPIDWAKQVDIVRREQFASRATEILEILNDVMTDSKYVIDNPSEFDPGTRSRALDDNSQARAAARRVSDLASATFAEFRDTGVTGSAFGRERLDQTVPEFKTYVQIESTASPVTPSAPRPSSDNDDYGGRNSHTE